MKLEYSFESGNRGRTLKVGDWVLEPRVDTCLRLQRIRLIWGFACKVPGISKNPSYRPDLANSIVVVDDEELHHLFANQVLMDLENVSFDQFCNQNITRVPNVGSSLAF